MSAVALTGSDTSILNNRIITDLGIGDCVNLDFPTEIASVKTGKNGNSVYALNESGKQSDVKLLVIRGSSDDKFLNNLIVQQQLNFAGTILIFGQFIKKVGDGTGNITNDTYNMGGGILTKLPGAKSNTEGDVTQSLVEYHLKFANAPRSLV